MNITKGVKGARIDETLYYPAVDNTRRKSFYEIEYIGKCASALPFLDNRINDIGSHPFDTCHSETDIALLVDGKCSTALVDVRSENFDFHPFAIIHQFGDFLNVVEVFAEVGSQKLSRIVCLKITGLITQPGITGGV